MRNQEEYTPSERVLEGAWATYRHTSYNTRAVPEAEFNRAIAKIKAEAWDECDDAWEQAHKMSHHEPWEYMKDNPYKESK